MVNCDKIDFFEFNTSFNQHIMDDLPVELLHEIAYNRSTYQALLAIPKFAKSLTPSTRCDYMIRFGYSIEITHNHIRWTLNGKLHRTDGPAVIYADGTQRWFIDGKLHRTDGPAIIYAIGTQAWYIDGKHHRTDGPAIIYADGSQAWYKDGKLHRTDGPAVIRADSTQEWYIHGNQKKEEEFNRLKS
jgi:hypothetical protein